MPSPTYTHYKRLIASAEADKWNVRFRYAIADSGLPIPVSEFVFIPGRKFRLDFAYPDKKIGIEIEGGIYREGGGAHSHPTNILRDIEKHNLAVMMGWRILRITPAMLSQGIAFKMLKELLTKKL